MPLRLRGAVFAIAAAAAAADIHSPRCSLTLRASRQCTVACKFGNAISFVAGADADHAAAAADHLLLGVC